MNVNNDSSEAETSTLYSLCYVTIARTKPYSCALGILDNLFCILIKFRKKLHYKFTMSVACAKSVIEILVFGILVPQTKVSLENTVHPLKNWFRLKTSILAHLFSSRRPPPINEG